MTRTADSSRPQAREQTFREDHCAALARLEREFLRADELMLILAAVAGRSEGDPPPWNDMTTEHRLLAGHAINEARQHTSRWLNLRPTHTVGLARHTVTDAVAAVDLRWRLPEAAQALGAPWRAATRVRDELRTLGPVSEETALRMAPSWRLDLLLLPGAVALVVLPPQT